MGICPLAEAVVSEVLSVSECVRSYLFIVLLSFHTDIFKTK